MTELSTFKLIVPLEESREDLEGRLRKHCKSFSIRNFYSKRRIGCNFVTFAIVDIDEDGIYGLSSEDLQIERICDAPNRSPTKDGGHPPCCGGGCKP